MQHGWRIGRDESDIAFSCGLPSVTPVQIAIEFYGRVEVMEANNMLLWPVLRDRVCDLHQVRNLGPEIQELYLSVAKLNRAQQGRRPVKLTRGAFRGISRQSWSNSTPSGGSGPAQENATTSFEGFRSRRIQRRGFRSTVHRLPSTVQFPDEGAPPLPVSTCSSGETVDGRRKTENPSGEAAGIGRAEGAALD
jgi:hypothetical protein